MNGTIYLNQVPTVRIGRENQISRDAAKADVLRVLTALTAGSFEFSVNDFGGDTVSVSGDFGADMSFELRIEIRYSGDKFSLSATVGTAGSNYRIGDALLGAELLGKLAKFGQVIESRYTRVTIVKETPAE
jgi:hypothetical protein